MSESDPEIRLSNESERYLTHSLEQLQLIKELRLKGSLSPSAAIYLAIQMVNHGFPEAISVISDLRRISRSPPVLELLSNLELRFRAIEGLTHRRAIFQDESLMRKLYLTEGATLVTHPTEHKDLIVVFLTAYNNFGFSNAVFLALLRQCGFSVLFLRDCSKYRFLKGVSGCGGTLHELADYITGVCTDNGFERVFMTGYSSGGYASLFMTTLVQTHAYLGFAIESDFGAGGPPATKTTRFIDLRGEVDGRYLLPLRNLVSEAILPGGRRFLIGANSAADLRQSECFTSMPGCSVEVVPDCGHEVISKLLGHGRLLQMFRQIRPEEGHSARSH